MSGHSDFPLDDTTLLLLSAACEINPDTGRTHLKDFLDMGSRVKSREDITAETFGEDAAEDDYVPRVYMVEHEEGFAPFSEHDAIRALVAEVQRLRARAAGADSGEAGS